MLREQPNVLMILVDDLAPVISAYGGPVSTPAIDQLAARGVRFTNNYANVPVCGASRASMLSGLAPTPSRFLSFSSRLDQDVEGSVSLPAFLKAHGWQTLANGKVFDVLADSADSWTSPVWNPEAQWFGRKPGGRGEHLQNAYLTPVPERHPPYFERLEVADTDYPDGQIAAKTVGDLHRLAHSTEPFFLAVGFRKPHLPFNAPQRYWLEAHPTVARLPTSWQAPGANVPRHALHRSPELRVQYDALPLSGDPSDAVALDIVSAYHAAVRYVDAQIGTVLAGLTASGAADRTIVVLLGDHGFLLGEQRMWTKHALFEPALRTPLIIADPRVAKQGEVTAVTDLLDVYPTVIELLGYEPPPQLDGVSLLPQVQDPTQRTRANKQASISRWLNGDSLRKGKYRYTRWFDNHGQKVGEMLFDLELDPHEQSNLAGEGTHAHVVIELEGYLKVEGAEPIWSEQLDRLHSRWEQAKTN